MGENCSYLDPAGTLVAVDIDAAPGFEAGTPRRLFHTPRDGNPVIEQYRVTADGERFLLKIPVGGPARGATRPILSRTGRRC